MTYRCPKCNAALSVSIELDTNFDKTKEHLSVLDWKRSNKKPNLSTIKVTDELLRSPPGNELYNRLKTSPNFAFKIERTSYRLSTFEGAEYVQRWEPISGD